MHPTIKILLECIELEEKEQIQRFQLDQQHSLKQLKAEGLALHPITVTRKTFGYLDYPEISFRLPFPTETALFRDGAAIECFCQGEEPVKAVLLNLDGKAGEFRIFAPDFPDWIETDGVGIKLAPDTRTTGIMKKCLTDLEKNPPLFNLFREWHEAVLQPSGDEVAISQSISFRNKTLNESQQAAVKAVVANDRTVILHGPPGTGKTTTLVEAIFQLVSKGEKLLVSAPSNTAVDNICIGLIRQGLNVLRIGNSSKVSDEIFSHTPEGKLAGSRHQKEIRELRLRAEEFRRMALKYKRNFGKEEREQRNLLFKEVKSIRNEIRKIQAYNEEKLFAEAQVIAGTPIGIHDAVADKMHFHTLIIDEAGQCIEPLAWCIFPFAVKYVLAGDPWQLPPTVLSFEATQKGFNQSILEIAMKHNSNAYLLNVQYRMKPVIAGFSNEYFYKGLLQTADHLINNAVHFTFIDTAGSGFEEKHGSDGISLQNEGELMIIKQLMEREHLEPARTAFISPYSGQVAAARETLPDKMRISTIDSFQGQEKEIVILSLVRSNDNSDIGFLKDYRRMNVAITRAKEQLFVIGDSATIGADPFYNAFLLYAEKNGDYRTVWEFEM